LNEFLDLPPSFLLLLSLSLAAGVDFPLTILVLGLSQLLGGPGIPEAAVHPFHWSVLAGITGLYLLEAGSEVSPQPSSIWHNLQLLLRPLGGVLIALVVLDGFPPRVQLVAAFGAGIVCAFSHVLSWGLKLLFFLNPDRKLSSAARMLAEDTLVLAFLILVLERPDLGFALSALILLLGLFLGGPLHHVVRFGFLSLWSEVFGLLSPPVWRDAQELPSWIRRGEGDLATSGIRGLPVGVNNVPGRRGFREGWLLESGSRRAFVFRRWGKPVHVPLDGLFLEEEGSLALARRFSMTAGDGARSALFLQRAAPDIQSHKS